MEARSVDESMAGLGIGAGSLDSERADESQSDRLSHESLSPFHLAGDHIEAQGRVGIARRQRGPRDEIRHVDQVEVATERDGLPRDHSTEAGEAIGDVAEEL